MIAYLMYAGSDREQLLVFSPPREDGWASILFSLDLETGEARPREGRGDERWLPAMPDLVASGHALELT